MLNRIWLVLFLFAGAADVTEIVVAILASYVFFAN